MSSQKFMRIVKGLRVEPKITSESDLKGSLEVLDGNSKLHYHDGTTNSSVVTENHAATLINKTIDAPANTITNIANSNMATMPAATIKGNNTGIASIPMDLTLAQVTAALSIMVGDTGSGGVKGLVPAPAAGDAALNKFLKADATWTIVPETIPLVTVVLNDNQVAVANILTLTATGNEDVILQYSIERSTNREVGFLYLTHNGTTSSVSTSGSNVGTTAVTFTSTISAGNVILQYTSTSTGSAPTMRYKRVSYIEVNNFASGITGTGTTGFLPKFASVSTIDDSELSYDNSLHTLTLNNASSGQVFSIKTLDRVSSGVSGGIEIKTGDGAPSGIIKNSGNISLQTGAAIGSRGSISLEGRELILTSDTSIALFGSKHQTSNPSSQVQVQSGNSTSLDTGSLIISTGNSSVANSGNIVVQTGTAGVTRGSITLAALNTSITNLSNNGLVRTNGGTGLLSVDTTAYLSGTVAIANGGTGQTTANTGYAALSPMTTNGDIVVRAGGVPIRLAAGAEGQVLSIVLGIPTWTSNPSGTPDNITIENSAGTLRVKDLGITSGKIADANVTTAKIANGNVTAAKIESNVNLPGSSAQVNGRPIVVGGTGEAANLRIIRGAFNATPSNTIGADFTVSHPGGTVTRITFNTPFSGSPVVTANCYGSSLLFCEITSVTSSYVDIRVRSANTYTIVYTDVMFIVIGPR